MIRNAQIVNNDMLFDALFEQYAKISKHQAETVAIVLDDETISYQELHDRVVACARNLETYGISKGKKVALLMNNRKEYVIACFALFKIGAWALPLNPYLEESEIRRLLKFADVYAVIFADHIGVASIQQKILCVSRNLRNINWLFGIDLLKKEQGVVDFQELYKPVGIKGLRSAVMPNDTAMLWLQPEGDGLQNGVCISHENCYRMTESLKSILDDNNCRIICTEPLYTPEGFFVMLSELLSGNGVHLLTTLNPNKVIKKITEVDALLVVTRPLLWRIITATSVFQFADLANLSTIVLYNSFNAGKVEKFPDGRQDYRLQFGFFSIEATGIVLLSEPTQGAAYRFCNVGIPTPGIEIKIVDNENESVAQGETGELLVKGSFMNSLYHPSGQTGNSGHDDGWFGTGILARYDDDNYICLFGKKSEQENNSAGFILSTEIETSLLQHRHVQEVAVVFVREQKLKIFAFVIPNPGEKLEPNELFALCGQQLQQDSVPDEIYILAQLPIDLSGKLNKNILRQWSRQSIPDEERTLFA